MSTWHQRTGIPRGSLCSKLIKRLFTGVVFWLSLSVSTTAAWPAPPNTAALTRTETRS